MVMELARDVPGNGLAPRMGPIALVQLLTRPLMGLVQCIGASSALHTVISNGANLVFDRKKLLDPQSGLDPLGTNQAIYFLMIVVNYLLAVLEHHRW